MARNNKKPNHEVQFKGEIEELYSKLTGSRRPWTLRRARKEFERFYVDYIINKSEGDRVRAAQRLDIGFSTLKEKIRDA
ncbi:MAG TPA: helix-turn-helix domain-containing protein [Kofleriaceae bacterium]|nr:helix-turn-helix domain-containing protein [Kofleriaceae bacterium]